MYAPPFVVLIVGILLRITTTLVPGQHAIADVCIWTGAGTVVLYPLLVRRM